MFISGAPALWLIPFLPALGAILIFVFAKWMKPRSAGLLACTMVGLSFVWVLVCASQLLFGPDKAEDIHQTHWRWLSVGVVQSDIAFYFDRISMVWSFIIAGVGFLIHLFSLGYMHGDEGEKRFFGWMNLFVASMLVLVTADNAFFMFMGWEGVGACSFALIGHYYSDPENVASAQKAFLVTRLGDIFLLLGLLLCARLAGVWFYKLDGFADIAQMGSIEELGGATGGTLVFVAGLLLLGGAIGKSAQLPLQVWLPDAMAGPTPVSALIHAATMVTAGVYLIARFHILFASSPELMTVVASIGVLTALYGATSAIVQTDIKRVLAYSTISQIGYMVLGLGVGAFSLGIFHFFTHAFYKALLFLAAGTVIHSLHGEQNIYNMGGLRHNKAMRGTFYAFIAGAASLAGIPLITAGFFSKDAILWSSLTTKHGNAIFYALGLFTALLTSIYSFRLVYIVFFGKPRKEIHVHAPGKLLTWPLYVLALFAVITGWLNLPAAWMAHPKWEQFFSQLFGHFEAHPFSDVPHTAGESHHMQENLAILASAVFAVGGAFIAWLLFRPERKVVPVPAMEIGEVRTNTPQPYRSRWMNLLYHGWGMDSAYMIGFVRTFQKAARYVARFDRVFIDNIYNVIAAITRIVHEKTLQSQNGRIPRYAMMMLFGAAAISVWVFVTLVLQEAR